MHLRPVWRFGLIFQACVFWAASTATAEEAHATPLGLDACNKLQTERQALTVLGVDKYFEKGPEWAKTNLGVADLNLVKRYLEVYEQLKFRCEKLVAIVEPPDLPDDQDDEEASASSEHAPPLPERRSEEVGKVTASRGPVSTPKSDLLKRSTAPTNAAAITVGPARLVPTR